MKHLPHMDNDVPLSSVVPQSVQKSQKCPKNIFPQIHSCTLNWGTRRVEACPSCRVSRRFSEKKVPRRFYDPLIEPL